MKGTPLISIIIPSFNQAFFVKETLQSLVDQNYAALEVIIQDPGSTDGSLDIIQDFIKYYPDIFSLYREKDRGQAHALNLGFAKAKGEILGYLNSDDTLYPGCLKSVAQEIDPERGCYIVFGRCLFTGEDSPYVGVEHPAEFVNHFEQLAIWKRGYNTLPQPSVFWHRQVWERCGGFNEREHHVMDYDLFCRFSKYFIFYKVDELWSTYRMHPQSKSSNSTEAKTLEMSIAASRRHWGSWWQPLRWRCEVSFWWHNRHLHEQARHHARICETALVDRHYFKAAKEFSRVFMLSPHMAWHRILLPRFGILGIIVARSLFFVRAKKPGGFTGHYGDGWVGPTYIQDINILDGASKLIINGEHIPQPNAIHSSIDINIFIGRKKKASIKVNHPGSFDVSIDLAGLLGNFVLKIETRQYFIPDVVFDNGDKRKLSFFLKDVIIK